MSSWGCWVQPTINQNNIIEQAAIFFFWRLLIHFGESFGYHPSTPQGADKPWSSVEAWAFLAIISYFISTNCKLFAASGKQWQENLAGPNSGQTGFFIDFSLHSALELEDWCMVKRKMYWERSKRPQRFVVCSDPNSAPQSQHRQQRIHFSWRITWQGDFCHLEEAANLILSWYYLIQVDTKLTMNSFAPVQNMWWVLALALRHSDYVSW